MRAAGLRLAAVFAIALCALRVDAGDGARAAAATFGKALVTARADALRPILPERGRVHLTLLRLGPEEGLFGAQQVEALFRDFLVRGTVSSFDVSRCEGDPRGAATAHATAAITDAEGRSGRIGLHLGFEPEGGRWVLREVKETAE
jgi:hypothetical protein